MYNVFAGAASILQQLPGIRSESGRTAAAPERLARQ